MKQELIEILRLLLDLEKNHVVPEVNILLKYSDILDDISVHENDCFTNLPDNMMFGKRGERYLLNTSELTSAANIVKRIAENLKKGRKIKGKMLEDIQKARLAVKHCIDR